MSLSRKFLYEDFECLVSVGGGDSSCSFWEETEILKEKSTGELYIYQGSGCSCNGPYEDVTEVADLERIDPNELHALEARVKDLDVEDRIEVIRVVKKAFAQRAPGQTDPLL